jgi:ParB/RepB/Spo0J family partition protein
MSNETELDALLQGNVPERRMKEKTRTEVKTSPHTATRRDFQSEVDASEENMIAIPDALLFPLKRIKPTTDQPRSEFDMDRVAMYARDMKRRHDNGRGVAGSGVLQPLLVRWEPGSVNVDGTVREDACVLITAGETRYHAAIKAGLTHVPVNIVDQDSEQAYEDALAENLMRTNLSEEDEARAFLYFKNRYNLSYPQLAEFIFHDKSRVGYVQNRIDSLRIDPDVRALIGRSKLNMTAARRIQAVKDPAARKELVQFALDGATLKQLEAKRNELFERRAYTKKDSKGQPTDIGLQTFESPAGENPNYRSVASEEAQLGIVGTPGAKDQVILPRFDLGNALSSMQRQSEDIFSAAKGARLGADATKKYRAQVKQIKELLDQLDTHWVQNPGIQHKTQ